MGTCMGVNHTMARFYPKPSLTVLGIQTESQACHGLCLHGLAPVTYPTLLSLLSLRLQPSNCSACCQFCDDPKLISASGCLAQLWLLTSLVPFHHSDLTPMSSHRPPPTTYLK